MPLPSTLHQVYLHPRHSNDSHRERADSDPSKSWTETKYAGGCGRGVAQVGVTEAVESREVFDVRPLTTADRCVDTTKVRFLELVACPVQRRQLFLYTDTTR